MQTDTPRLPVLALEGLLVAAVLMGISAVLVTPTLEPIYMGKRYQDLSAGAPPLFAQGAEALRPLGPTLGRWLHLGGERWIAFPLLVGLGWLALVHGWLRGHLPRRLAVATVALLALGTPITWTLVFPGYVDTLSYLLLWLSVLAAMRCSPLWALPFTVAILNNEAILFMAPALLAQTLTSAPAGRRLRSGVLWALMFGLALGVAWWIRTGMAVGEQPSLSRAGGALVQDQALMLGVFAAFEVAWMLPVALVLFEWRAGQLRASWVVGAVLIGAVAQLGFAVDTTRLLGVAFVAILLSVVELRRHLPAAWLGWLLAAVLAMNVAIPQVFGVPQGLVVTEPLPVSLMRGKVGLRDVQVFRAPRSGPRPQR